MRKKIAGNPIGQRLDKLHRLTRRQRHHPVAESGVTDSLLIIIVSCRALGIHGCHEIDHEFLPEPGFFGEHAMAPENRQPFKADNRLCHAGRALSCCEADV